MGHPLETITFGVPEASIDGRLYTRYPQGTAPNSAGAAQGLGVTVTASASTGSATGGTSGGGEDSLTANAYSDYTTFWLDPLNGNDANNGTSKLTAKKTLSAASALLTGGGRRLIIVPSATIVLGAHWSLPAGGSSNSARVVVMGEPEAAELPEIVGTGGQFNARFALNGARPFVTLRKVHMHSFFCDGGAVRVGYPNAMHDFVGEWCHIHDVDWDDNCGTFYLQNGAAHRTKIRYCKLYHVHAGGAWFHNSPVILNYANEDVEIHHCDMSDAEFCFRSKHPNTSGHGAHLHHNVMSHCKKHINLMRDLGNDSNNYSGFRVTHSLLYDAEDNGFHLVDANTQSEDVEIDHVTFGEDAGWTHIELQGAKASITNSIFANDDAYAIMTKDPGSLVNRILRSNNNGFRSGSQNILGEYLSGTSRREYPLLTQWQSAKTDHNHVDLSELDEANPDLDSVLFSSLTDEFTAHASRNYRLKDASSLKGIASDGGDPGYDPDDCGAGW